MRLVLEQDHNWRMGFRILELQNFLDGYKNVLPVIPVGGQDHMVLYLHCVFKLGHLSIGKYFCEVSGKYCCQFSVTADIPLDG